MKLYKHILFAYLLVLMQNHGRAQSISFSNITTSNGLSDNYIQSLVLDHHGFLWIGTSDGLNRYDGYNMTSWNASDQSGLPSDTIKQLYCDSKNQIWVTTPGKLAVSQGDKFQTIPWPENGSARMPCYAVFEIKGTGLIAFTSEGHFLYHAETQKFEKLDWLSLLIPNKAINSAVPFGDRMGIYVFESKVVAVDFESKRIVFEKAYPHAITACKYDEHSIAVASRKGQVWVTDLNTKADIKNYQFSNEDDGGNSTPRVSEMVKLSNGDLALATLVAGLTIIDSLTGEIRNYRHQSLNSSSLISNNLFRVLGDSNGELMIASHTSGLSIANVKIRDASFQQIFRNASGEIYDGLINEMNEGPDGQLWICGYDRLIRWNKKENIADFYYYPFKDQETSLRRLEMRTICMDAMDRVWVGALGAGVALFNPRNQTFNLINKDSTTSPSLHNTYVNDLIVDSKDQLWAGTYSGLYRIDVNTLRIRTCEEDSVLKVFSNKVVISLFEDAQKRIWIGTQRFGIYCYDQTSGLLINYTRKEGLLNNTASAIAGDRRGNIYTAHLNGFSVIAKDGTIRHFSKGNGMLNARCESIVIDNQDNVWISNNKCLVRFVPEGDVLTYFEENTGIHPDGFRFDSGAKGKDGTLYFGTHRGINYFDPTRIENTTEQLQVMIDQVAFPDSVIHPEHSLDIIKSYRKNSVEFHFALINLKGAQHMAYQYILEGYDAAWQKGNTLRSVRYASLPSGSYTFKVKASLDRIHWTESSNEVKLTITPPLWKRWWFILTGVAGALVGFFAFTQFRINQVRKQEKIKAVYSKQMAETEMKALRAQMNPHFIFNSLNSINKYILKNDHVNASRYLTRFAKLIRLILDNSNHKEVALSDELEALRLYMEMESLRFNNKFEYSIIVADDISQDTIQVPPLMVQPYVENAIWHGLLHKGSEGKLSIQVEKVKDQMIRFTIEDNGVGRAKALEMKSKSATTNKSLGMKLTQERLQVLNQYNGLHAKVEIIDLLSNAGEAIGTRVILTLPI